MIVATVNKASKGHRVDRYEGQNNSDGDRQVLSPCPFTLNQPGDVPLPVHIMSSTGNVQDLESAQLVTCANRTHP